MDKHRSNKVVDKFTLAKIVPCNPSKLGSSSLVDPKSFERSKVCNR